MPTLIVHAGLPKTGTSALQAALHSGRANLLQSGVLWPDSVASPIDPRHLFMHKEPLALDDCPTLKNALNEAKRDSLDTVIVSSEGLTVQSKQLSKVRSGSSRAALQDWTVRLIVCTRSKKSWEPSLYRQCIMNPPAPQSDNDLEQTYATGETFDDWRKRPVVSELGDPKTIAARLEPLFGKAELITFDQGGDVVSGFMAAAGLAHVRLPSIPRRNLSPDAAKIEVLRRANASQYNRILNPALRSLMQSGMGVDGNIGLSKNARRQSLLVRSMVALWLGALRFQDNPGLDVQRPMFENARKDLFRLAIQG